MPGGQARVLTIDALNKFASDLKLFDHGFLERLASARAELLRSYETIVSETESRRQNYQYFLDHPQNDATYRGLLQKRRDEYFEACGYREQAKSAIEQFDKHRTYYSSIWSSRSTSASSYMNSLHTILQNYASIHAARSDSLASQVPPLPSDPDMIGDPVGNGAYYVKQEGMTCSVMSQWEIIWKLTGKRLDPDEIVNEAYKKGILNAATGTLLPDIGKLCDAHGLATSQSYGQTMEDLKKAISSGKEVIAQVQAGILWGDGRSGGHSVWVTGMDDENVYINDTGNDKLGAGAMIPIDQFNNAWQSFGGHATSCWLPAK
jgi:hypothetical protein